MTPQMAILVIPAAAVVTGLVLHSIRFRGGRDTLYFFLFALLFGIARGNVIYWITTAHFKGKFPYIFQKRLVGVYHDSLTADFGWIICLYLGSYLAFRIADRMPHIRGRLFPAVSLACLFNVCLSYAVEATAMTMGWWQWNLSTKSSILSDVPMVGIVAWFSVGFDFLIPYYLIRHYRRPGQRWPFLTLLIFPLHMVTHLIHERISGAVPITPYNLYHWFMFMAALILPFAVGLKMRKPWLPPEAVRRGGARKGPRKAKESRGRSDLTKQPGWFTTNTPALGLGVVVAVLLISDLGITGDGRLLVSKVPLAYYAAMAVFSVPAVFVLAAGALIAVIGGKLLIPPVVVPFFCISLRGLGLWSKVRRLKLVYLLVPLLLTGWYYSWSKARDAVDREYVSMCNSGLRLAEEGAPDSAIVKFEEAAKLRPYSLRAYQNLSILYSRTKRYGEAERVLRKILELRPVSEEAHANMGNLYMLRGDLDEAERWFNMALDINPAHEYSLQMKETIARLRKSSNNDGSSGR